MAFRFRGFEFRPRGWATLIAAAMVVMAMALGGWQMRRAEDKLARQKLLDERSSGPVLELPGSPVDAAEFDSFRVSVHGEFAERHTFLVDNRLMRGAVGYNVLTPLRIPGSDLHVVVNRGWVAAGARREDLPVVRTPRGPVRVQGIAVVPPRRHYELGHETSVGPVVQNLSLERIAQRTGFRLQPIVILQTDGTDDGLVRSWVRPDLGVDSHRGYALQWYLLAALVAVLYVVHSSGRIERR